MFVAERPKQSGFLTKRAMDGHIVGAEAEPICPRSFGSRLLQSMGWTGGGLGICPLLHVSLSPIWISIDHAKLLSPRLVGTGGEGIAEPLTAIVKNNRKGLGYTWWWSSTIFGNKTGCYILRFVFMVNKLCVRINCHHICIGTEPWLVRLRQSCSFLHQRSCRGSQTG